jgi:hypothetical protein
VASLKVPRKNLSKRLIKKKTRSNRLESISVAEQKLEFKKKELLRAKAHYRRLAVEFIDQWVKVRKLKKLLSQSKLK